MKIIFDSSESIGILIIGINLTLCIGGAISILIAFIWGCLDARKIQLRKNLD